MTNTDLVSKAIAARNQSYSPYSNFKVGAALLTKDGRLYQGCNIENAAYSPGICAERTAFSKAISEGEQPFSFQAVAVAGWPKDYIQDSSKPQQAFPCGVCRQVMREFCEPDFKVLIATGIDNNYTEHTLEELLPYGFGPENLA